MNKDKQESVVDITVNNLVTVPDGVTITVKDNGAGNQVRVKRARVILFALPFVFLSSFQKDRRPGVSASAMRPELNFAVCLSPAR